MNDPVKKVELLNLQEREDITEQLTGKSIAITLSDDRQITIELFERDSDAAIEIRTGTGRLSILPVASNVIKVKEVK
jgi:hypothetical protein